MPETSEKELMKRLLEYTEEPDKDLWQNIVPFIVSVNPEPQWIIWITRFSVLLIGVSIVFLLPVAVTDGVEETGLQTFPAFAAKDSIESRVLLSPPGESALSMAPADVKTTVKTRHAGQNSLQRRVSNLDTHASWKNGNVAIVLETDSVYGEHEGAAAVRRLPLTSYEVIRPSINEHESKADLTKRRKKGKPERVQSRVSDHKQNKLFSLYFTAMPTFGYQRIKANVQDNLLIESIRRIPAFSKDRLGVRLEAGVEIPVSKRWKVFGGALYYQRSQTIDYVEKKMDSMITGSGKFEPQFTYLSKSREYELKNVGLQFGVSYRLWKETKNAMTSGEALSSNKIPTGILKKRFVHEAGAGIEFHKNLSRSSDLENAEGFSDPSTYVFLNMYYRLQYPNTGRLRAILQPTINYSFYINENLNAPFYVKPYGLGLNFGCKYHFR